MIRLESDTVSDARFCLGCDASGRCCLETLPWESLVRVRRILLIQRFSRGVTVFRQGELAAGVSVIRSGWFRLAHLTSEGKIVTLGVLGPGGVLGLNELMVGGRFHASAEVLADAETEYFPGGSLRELVRSDANLAVALLTAISRDSRRTVAELCDVAGKRPPEERLLSKLSEIAHRCGRRRSRGIQLRLPFTVQELAESIGCSRQWTTKLLQDLVEKRRIERHGAWITLLES